MLRVDSEYEMKSKTFDYKWLFPKMKSIVSGLDTKVNLRVSLYNALLNTLTMKTRWKWNEWWLFHKVQIVNRNVKTSRSQR